MDIYLNQIGGVVRTLSLRASNDTTSPNFARHKTASWIRTTPSNVKEKINVCILIKGCKTYLHINPNGIPGDAKTSASFSALHPL